MLRSWYKRIILTFKGDFLDSVVKDVKDPMFDLRKRVDSILSQARVDGEKVWMYRREKPPNSKGLINL